MKHQPKYHLNFGRQFHLWYELMRGKDPKTAALESALGIVKNLQDALLGQCAEGYPRSSYQKQAFSNTHVALYQLEQNYREGDPVALIEAFILAVREFDVAPHWVMQELLVKFNNWHVAAMHRKGLSLDQCFQVHSKTRSTPVDRHNLVRRDGKLCHEMHCLLVMIPQLPACEAAELVAATDQENGGGEIGPGNLNGKYSSSWKRVFERDPYFRNSQKSLPRA